MQKYSKNIRAKMKEYTPFRKALFTLVKAYDHIAIFAHKSPDYDAFGSQFGLGVFLKEHFPLKDIKIVGQSNDMYNGGLYPEMDEVSDEWFETPFLALIVDTSSRDRISDVRYQKAAYSVKIDHHPNVEPFGNLMLVDVSAVAVSEILAILLLGSKFHVSLPVANYLFTGIVGDSGRFKYASTTALTFGIVEELLNIGVNINELYNELYETTLTDLAMNGYILSNYKITPNGFAYYVLTDETLKKLGVSVERGKESVNIFSGIRAIKVWAAITEDKANNNFRVSIRSAKKPINEFAAKWHGGGHVQASGATIYHENDIAKFVAEMDEFIRD